MISPGANNIFTVDVEDYFQVTAFESDIPRHSWHQYESRVEANTRRVLELLAQHGVRATFFVLGWVARHYPKLVEEVHRTGHEIGSHGYWHRLIYEQTPQQFREDLRLSRDVLEQAIGNPVNAYRAPSFSITKDSLWALEILAEEAIRFDSSIFPVYHDRYGIPGANREIHPIDTPAGTIWEFPPSTGRFGRLNIPLSGGGYFRILPCSFTKYALGQIQNKRPFIFYIHPWELDPDQPRLAAGSLASRIRHRVNLHSTERKLSALLQHFRFGAMADFVSQHPQGATVSQPWPPR